MTDIVERLHKAVAHIVCEDGCDIDKVMAEAADAIAQLRQDVSVACSAICAENDNMKAEIEQLRDQVATLRELRTYDAKIIKDLRGW